MMRLDKHTRYRHNKILLFIEQFSFVNGYPPTLEQIAKGVGIVNRNTLVNHLTKLKRLGLVEEVPRKTSVFALSQPPTWQENVYLPFVSEVKPGLAVLSPENIVAYYSVPRFFTGEGDKFFLMPMPDQGLCEIGIYAGDILIVRHSGDAQNGELTAAWKNTRQVTVRRFFREGGFYYLQPENQHEQLLRKTHISVVGTVRGVFRSVETPSNLTARRRKLELPGWRE